MIAVLGAGAFGTALAVALSRGGRNVTLFARDPEAAAKIERNRVNARRLPEVELPRSLTVAASIGAVAPAETILVACPMQAMSDLLHTHREALDGKMIVACCKGIELETGSGPSGLIARHLPAAAAAVLSGPGIADDIGRGRPTALVLATSAASGPDLQRALSTPTLRLYLSRDPVGVETGGALKNVVAIACGAAIGAGLGESARAALMTRGYAEMVRFATSRGARPETLAGLSGLGDLALTSMSEKSRNYQFGRSLGAGEATIDQTTEGIATASAVARLAMRESIDMPVACAVADVIAGKISVADAIERLLARPLRAE